nr:hypothetical protein TEA_016824 [Ipomoea batatas]
MSGNITLGTHNLDHTEGFELIGLTETIYLGSNPHRNPFWPKRLQTVYVLGRNPVLRDEGIELVIAAHLHFPELDLGPGIHCHGSHEGNVDPEAAVLAGALEAHEDAVGDGRPLRILLRAIHADPVPRARIASRNRILR